MQTNRISLVQTTTTIISSKQWNNNIEMQVCGKKSSLCVNQSCALFYNQQRLADTSTQSWRNFQQQQQPERTASPDGAPKLQCLWNAYELQMSWSVSRIRCDGVEECTWMLQRDDSQICCWFIDETQRERARVQEGKIVAESVAALKEGHSQSGQGLAFGGDKVVVERACFVGSRARD